MNFWSVRNVQKDYISINPYLSSNKKFYHMLLFYLKSPPPPPAPSPHHHQERRTVETGECPDSVTFSDKIS